MLNSLPPSSGPSFSLSKDQISLQETARHVATTVAGPMAAETDRSETYPFTVVEALTQAGLKLRSTLFVNLSSMRSSSGGRVALRASKRFAHTCA